MRASAFSKRCFKEVLQDPVSAAFGIGLPLVLLFLMSAIQSKVPVKLFTPDKLTPGIVIFSYSFLTLFSASIVSKDRSTAFFARLYTTPMKPIDFIVGYTVPFLPFAAIQTAVITGVAMILGLRPSLDVLAFCGLSLACAPMFIFMGLLFGSILKPSQVGGICGAVLSNLTAWTSGAWFDVELVGGAFKAIASALPFYHAVELGRAVLAGDPGGGAWRILPVLGYTVLAAVLAVVLFTRQMKKQ